MSNGSALRLRCVENLLYSYIQQELHVILKIRFLLYLLSEKRPLRSLSLYTRGLDCILSGSKCMFIAFHYCQILMSVF
jgi:hypothetical protein